LFYEAKRNWRSEAFIGLSEVPVKDSLESFLSANGKELLRRTRAAICKQFERRLK
jgi:hypothetical protein